MEPNVKKAKLEIFDVPAGTHTPKEAAEAYADAVKSHPFYDNAHSIVDLYDSATIKDGQGRIVGVVLRKALPEYAASTAAKLLIAAAVRTTLRSSMFGGEAPLSGIAGYFDYRGSPVELKARKTSFTHEHAEEWPAVFPLVDYVSEIYRRVMPEQWEAQNAAIPDIVRIHGTPYSTLTINSKFRTASHTDAGDFDGGYSCIACVDGNFKGLALTFDDFRVNVLLQPRDVLVFDSHHFHSNTEVETVGPAEEWNRLTCVFYYRSALGEASSYAEYQRRLTAAQQDPNAHPAVQHIPVKPNGVNLSRPSPVHPITPSPFGVITALHRLRHCAAKAARVHAALIANSSCLAAALFGEPLACADGIPLRCPEEKLKANSEVAQRRAKFGGFSETTAKLASAAEKRRYLSREYLADFISAELLDMWMQARAQWLELVLKDWKQMLVRNPDRADYTWKNHSDMNAAFFDLCEVGKQVLLGLLDKEIAAPAEEQAFWAMFAMHLNASCADELHMPAEAMSLRKLNVKLKDFHFGGTRYFKDMPAEEQQRRVERKKRIEEARRCNATDGATARRSTWLTNDAFDYQSEDCEVDYAARQWVLPARHAEDVTRHVHVEDDGELGAGEESVTVLVVLPRGRRVADAVKPEELIDEMSDSAEWMRLMSSPAVHRVLHGERRNAALPSPLAVQENTTVHFAYHDCLPNGTFDFVVLQHVLSGFPDDDAASQYIRSVAALCTGSVLVAETDVQCRQYYALHFPLRVEYDAVAPAFFQALHRAAYGTKLARMRTKREVEALYPFDCCARYKLDGSPLNTAVHLLALH